MGPRCFQCGNRDQARMEFLWTTQSWFAKDEEPFSQYSVFGYDWTGWIQCEECGHVWKSSAVLEDT